MVRILIWNESRKSNPPHSPFFKGGGKGDFTGHRSPVTELLDSVPVGCPLLHRLQQLLVEVHEGLEVLLELVLDVGELLDLAAKVVHFVAAAGQGDGDVEAFFPGLEQFEVEGEKREEVLLVPGLE